jgi:hypothetical protein
MLIVTYQIAVRPVFSRKPVAKKTMLEVALEEILRRLKKK